MNIWVGNPWIDLSGNKYSYLKIHIIQICSGITNGRVLDGELLCTKILEVNLFVFAYRLFHIDFFPTTGRYINQDR